MSGIWSLFYGRVWKIINIFKILCATFILKLAYSQPVSKYHTKPAASPRLSAFWWFEKKSHSSGGCGWWGGWAPEARGWPPSGGCRPSCVFGKRSIDKTLKSDWNRLCTGPVVSRSNGVGNFDWGPPSAQTWSDTDWQRGQVVTRKNPLYYTYLSYSRPHSGRAQRVRVSAKGRKPKDLPSRPTL